MVGMYKRLSFLFFVMFLLFSTFFTTGVSANCSPYELYSVDSVFKLDGWLLIRISHWSYTCEMIAGEWTPVLISGPDRYYLLTDGNKTILLGSDVGLVNETLYVLTVTSACVSYQNLTITIEGKPHNFTLLKNMTVKTLYHFNGLCFENASTCRIILYPNGTRIDMCRGLLWNASFLKSPNVSLTGVPVKVERGRLHFMLGKNYTITSPEGINTSDLKLRAFTAKMGVVLINTGVIKVPAGTTLEEIPILFVIKDGTAQSAKILKLEESTCKSMNINTIESPYKSVTASSNNKIKGICGPGFVVLIILSVLLLNKRR
ncbi:hypothetical protein [Thermococcus sp.]|uniref:hypothetical protein n=1 Tax=Thermococcus sp. TaxID=35749 RepID=UPI0026362781|nr:hypothetical protein [Thermococcus sp.]